MSNLRNTYCNNNEKNLARYIDNGFKLVKSKVFNLKELDEAKDFIIAQSVLEIGDVCYIVNKDNAKLQHYKFIDDVEEYTKEYLGIIGNRGPGPGLKGIRVTDEVLNYTSGLSIDTSFVFPVGLTTGGDIDVNNHEKQYGESKVITILEHILSFQTPANQWSNSNTLNVDTIIRELNKFGFYPNPHGRKIDE